MRRRLILMRHAKSSWKSDAQTDHERPLNKRGRRAAPAMGRHLEALGWRPDLVLASDARRTVETAELMVAAMQAPSEVHRLRALYLSDQREIQAAIEAVDPGLGTILVLGHNPGWESALAWFSGVEEPLKAGDAALLEAESEAWGPLFAAEGGFELITVVRARAVEEAERAA